MRLTKDIKAQIIKAAVTKAGIPKRSEQLREQWAAWAEDCRVEALGRIKYWDRDKVALLCGKIDQLVEQLPKEVLSNHGVYRTSDQVHVNVGGKHITVGLNGATKIRMNYTGKNRVYRVVSGERLNLAASHTLAKQWEKLNRIEDQIDADKADLEADVAAVLSQANTDKQLLELWPESAELIPKPVEPPRAQMPAVLPGKLNATIGLPSGEAS